MCAKDALPTLRAEIDELLAAGKPDEARSVLRRLWRQYAGPATAEFVRSRLEKLSQGGVAPCRLAVLRSFTLEPAIGVLRAAALLNGIDLRVQLGDFNAFAQELLDEGSSLYAFSPDTVILAVQTRDIAPELWHGFASLAPQEVQDAVDRVSRNIAAWVQRFRSISPANLIIHNFEVPSEPSHGIGDGRSQLSQLAAIRQINEQLGRISRQHHGVYVLDYDGLVAVHGRQRWHDERRWLTMRMPLAGDALVPLAEEWLRFLHPLTGRLCKALVVDLDNTLWGGVIGEDGMQGIQVGPEYPGAGYRALQQVMLDFYHRGILLAVCSKNNPDDAQEALADHPGMLLRPGHFAALRINWMDKAQNLREIAAELNVGLDALAFLDDNPVEREHVRRELPEVTVIELPPDAMQFADVLRRQPVFERLAVTSDDRERGRYYGEQRLRSELEQGAGSLEQFYHSLRQELEIAPVTAGSVARVAQLTQKTNQFNLTTRRYSEAQIADFAASPDWRVYSVNVRDRFGDNGLVGVVIARREGGAWDIDTFLLSCRVIGRTVETGILAFLIQEARSHGIRQLRGWFLPTKKNAPACDFYPKHGFAMVTSSGEGTVWSLDLTGAALACPAWLKFLTPTKDAQ